mgnify:FL=1
MFSTQWGVLMSGSLMGEVELRSLLFVTPDSTCLRAFLPYSKSLCVCLLRR